MYKIERLDEGNCIAVYRDKNGIPKRQKHIKCEQVIRRKVNEEELLFTDCYVELWNDNNLYKITAIVKDKNIKSLSIFDFVGCELRKVKPFEMLRLLHQLSRGRVSLIDDNVN